MQHYVEEVFGELMEEKAIKIAKNLLKMGDSAEKVAMATGLDISVVLKLKTTKSKPTSTTKHSAKTPATRQRPAVGVRHT